MKTSNERFCQTIFRKTFAILLLVFLSVSVFAQDAYNKTDPKTNLAANGFFGSPWIWVVGIAVFVLLLVALLRGSGRRGDA